LGLAVREGWEVERGLAERGRGTAYYAYVDGERYVLSRNPHLLLRMAGARRY